MENRWVARGRPCILWAVPYPCCEQLLGGAARHRAVLQSPSDIAAL